MLRYRASDSAMPAGAILLDRRKPHSAPKSRQRDNDADEHHGRRRSRSPKGRQRGDFRDAVKAVFAPRTWWPSFRRQRATRLHVEALEYLDDRLNSIQKVCAKARRHGFRVSAIN